MLSRLRVMFVGLVCLASFSSMAAELNDVKMSDDVKLGDKNLALNGMALRKVNRFGIPVKVYIAGLYLEEKNGDGDKILDSKMIKHLEMEFVRTVEKEKITDAWSETVFAGCLVECETYKEPLKEFNNLMGEMRKGQRMIISFYPDRVEVDQKGRTPKKGIINSGAFSKNLLAIFIGPKMFSEEVKNGLLGKNK